MKKQANQTHLAWAVQKKTNGASFVELRGFVQKSAFSKIEKYKITKMKVNKTIRSKNNRIKRVWSGCQNNKYCGTDTFA